MPDERRYSCSNCRVANDQVYVYGLVSYHNSEQKHYRVNNKRCLHLRGAQSTYVPYRVDYVGPGCPSVVLMRHIRLNYDYAAMVYVRIYIQLEREGECLEMPYIAAGI